MLCHYYCMVTPPGEKARRKWHKLIFIKCKNEQLHKIQRAIFDITVIIIRNWHSYPSSNLGWGYLMVRETWVQTQVMSYQRLEKWYLIPLCLTLSNIRYVSRVKWSNPGKGVAPSPTHLCSSYWKGSLWVTLDYGCELNLLILPPDKSS